MIGQVQIQGATELNRLLRILPQKVSKQIQMKSIRQGARILVKAVKAEAPKRTGILSKSVGVTTDKSRVASMYVGVRTGRKQKYDGWYGWFVHGGTKGVGKRKRSASGTTYSKSGKGIKANPFFQRAWDATQESVYEAIKRALQENVLNFLKSAAPKYY